MLTERRIRPHIDNMPHADVTVQRVSRPSGLNDLTVPEWQIGPLSSKSLNLLAVAHDDHPFALPRRRSSLTSVSAP
jgi:hypothetical protein